MVKSKKEQERDELHKSIWKICNDLRGIIDGWDFKNYILGTMFYSYLSEDLISYINKVQGDGFDYVKISNEDAEKIKDNIINEKGFFIYPSELFCNVVSTCEQDDNLSVDLNNIFGNIEKSSNKNFKGIFNDFDVNSNKLGSTVQKRNEKLLKLIDGIANMNLASIKDQNIDAFGDAYEYLMGMYASNAGKSGGEFFTPAGVSELLTRLGTVGKTEVNKVYDPSCGSGSLLLKSLKILGKENVRYGFFGQEINTTSYNLCRINMILHGVEFNKFNIFCDDTLTNPKYWDDEPFDLIVSNPPYSIKWEGSDNVTLINDSRFSPAGVLAPKSKADLAFIMHCLPYLSNNGTAVVVCFPGIFYRGGTEKKIREYLVNENFIDCIIQLPSNLFFGTSIATCIMVMKKNKKNNKTLFIDASNEYVKDTNNNKLNQENINRIVEIFTKREDIDHISRLVSYEEIKENDFNLSVSTYVEAEDTREKIDIDKLNAEIKDIIALQQELRNEINKIILGVEKY